MALRRTIATTPGIPSQHQDFPPQEEANRVAEKAKEAIDKQVRDQAKSDREEADIVAKNRSMSKLNLSDSDAEDLKILLGLK